MAAETIYIAVGTVFLAGLALDRLGRQVHVPRATLLMLLGLLIGGSGIGLVPDALVRAGEGFAPLALTMVAFLMGGALKRETLYAHGREILILSLSVVLVSMAVVAGGLWLIGTPIAVAALLGAIAAATAPAATLDTIRQSGQTGRFARNLEGIVAVDDAWGLIVFSLALTGAGAALGDGTGVLWHGMRELFGSILLGLALGLPGAALTGRLKPGEPSLMEALGIVFLVTGAALWLELSYLLAGMTAGVTIVNVARHHDRPFHEIERIEWPFVLLFFVVAGAGLDLASLGAVGAMGAAYVALRAMARLVGGLLGGRLAGVGTREGVLTGMALMPQAGVAIGMALVATDRLPGIGADILTVAVASTVVFELVGPLLTQAALARTSESQDNAGGDAGAP